jgi:hypothetical protein
MRLEPKHKAFGKDVADLPRLYYFNGGCMGFISVQ